MRYNLKFYCNAWCVYIGIISSKYLYVQEFFGSQWRRLIYDGNFVRYYINILFVLTEARILRRAPSFYSTGTARGYGDYYRYFKIVFLSSTGFKYFSQCITSLYIKISHFKSYILLSKNIKIYFCCPTILKFVLV